MRFPQLYQVNARFWLAQRSADLGRQATLDDLPDDELRRLAELGFDWLYLLGVWQTGRAEARIAQEQAPLQRAAAELLGEAGRSAICASPFAISGYRVPRKWGGGAALKRLRQRLHAHGLRLMLDFIPNHTGISHPWAIQRPDYYVQLSPGAGPGTFYEVQTEAGPQRLAHGRDPYFPPWSDTLQLNYASPDLQRAMTAELLRAASYCDGLRCDMAMLILPEVFARTWGVPALPFWAGAITRLKARRPGFVLMAEVYWGLESALLRQGFDYVYDKALLDRLVEEHAPDVRRQLETTADLEPRLAHFLENHDEPRIASRLPLEAHRAAALLTYFQPGLRFFFAGQLEGFCYKAPVQLCRPPAETPDPDVAAFYHGLLEQLRGFAGRLVEWKLLEARPAWNANPTWQNFIVASWRDERERRWLGATNYASYRGQCYVPLPFDDLPPGAVTLHDRLGEAVYPRLGSDLRQPGLYLDLPAWGLHLFELVPGA